MLKCIQSLWIRIFGSFKHIFAECCHYCLLFRSFHLLENLRNNIFNNKCKKLFQNNNLKIPCGPMTLISCLRRDTTAKYTGRSQVRILVTLLWLLWLSMFVSKSVWVWWLVWLFSICLVEVVVYHTFKTIYNQITHFSEKKSLYNWSLALYKWPSKWPPRASWTASSGADRPCSCHVSPLSLLNMQISLSRSLNEAKWGISIRIGLVEGFWWFLSGGGFSGSYGGSLSKDSGIGANLRKVIMS